MTTSLHSAFTFPRTGHRTVNRTVLAAMTTRRYVFGALRQAAIVAGAASVTWAVGRAVGIGVA